MAIKRAFHLCGVQLGELLRAPIFYTYLCLFFVYFHYLNASTVRLQAEAGIQVNAWGYTVGVFSNFETTLVFGLGAVMLFSDLPLIRDNALFESTRCSRNVWIGGRMLYVLCVSVLYTFFMLFFCMMTCGGNLLETGAWDKLLNTVANGYNYGEFSMPIELTLDITGAFTPLQALGVTALMCVLAALFMGLCILCLSLALGRMAALTGASMLAVFDFVIYQKLPFWCYRLSPLSLTRLSIVYHPHMPDYPTIPQGLCTLLAVNVLCMGLAFFLSHLNHRFANNILKEQY